MRLNSWDIVEPAPELNQPHALAIIRPWIDVSGVGSLVLSSLEAYLGAKELGKLTRPGDFFDFTRYRPTFIRKANNREVIVPNTTITYGISSGIQTDSHDFVFLRLLEPHMQAEAYVDSVIELFRNFGVKRYCLLGSMFDMVPYTRPLLITGNASNPGLQNELALANVRHSDYQGITSILSLIGNRAIELGIETCSMIIHLPNYLTMEEDYRGEKRLMEVISFLYGFSLPKEDMEKANEQEEQVRLIAEQILKQDPRLGEILKQLEAHYDTGAKQDQKETTLSPEVEKFLLDLDRRFRQESP
jgi:PAC2 family